MGGIVHFLLKIRRIEWFTAHPAPDQIHRDHIIPLADQKMLKFDGILRANPPALPAAGAFGHVVPKRTLIVLILIAQSRGRTIFHTRQTTIAIFVYTKV
jgi:hypothetical protein